MQQPRSERYVFTISHAGIASDSQKIHNWLHSNRAWRIMPQTGGENNIKHRVSVSEIFKMCVKKLTIWEESTFFRKAIQLRSWDLHFTRQRGNIFHVLDTGQGQKQLCKIPLAFSVPIIIAFGWLLTKLLKNTSWAFLKHSVIRLMLRVVLQVKYH